MVKNKFVAALLSALVAFGLWLYVITVVSPGSEETFYDIPVSLQGEALLESNGLMIVSKEIPTVTLKLSGNRTDLNQLDPSNIRIVVDLSKIYEAGTANLRYTPYYPGSIAEDAVTEQSRYPDTITLEVERKIKKDVPLKVVYSGKLQEDFVADTEKVELTNSVGEAISTVQVSGPKSVIDKIAQAVIEVDLTGRSVSFSESYRYSLCDDKGEPVDVGMVETNTAEINLTLYIQRMKQIQLAVTVVNGGGATEETSDILIEPATITVAGSESVLEALEDVLVLGTIDLATLTSDTELVFPVTLSDGVTNLSLVTEAKVTVKFPELLTKTFTVTKFSAMNVPEGLEAEILAQALQVTVRGPKNLVNKMKERDITVSVDFANAQIGTFTLKPTIVMGSNYKEVGAVGTYSISATLRDPLETMSDDPDSTSPQG